MSHALVDEELLDFEEQRLGLAQPVGIDSDLSLQPLESGQVDGVAKPECGCLSSLRIEAGESPRAVLLRADRQAGCVLPRVTNEVRLQDLRKAIPFSRASIAFPKSPLAPRCIGL